MAASVAKTAGDGILKERKTDRERERQKRQQEWAMN